MNKSWSSESQVTSYNNWLREEALGCRSLLTKNTARLREQLLVLDSVICLEQTSIQRLERVLAAITHVLTEIHLLVTLTEEK